MAMREGTVSGLLLTDGGWLRDAWEFAPSDAVFFGRDYRDHRIGLVRTVPVTGTDVHSKLYAISETLSDPARRIITANMGYTAARAVVRIGYLETGADEPVVPDALKGVDMVDFGHETSVGRLLDLHRGRLEGIRDVNQAITEADLERIYTDLVYESPRHP